MGGYGSGPQYRRPSTSEAMRVDIRYMRKNSLLRSGKIGSLHWSCGGRPSGDIRYSVAHNGGALILDYKVREVGGEWQPMILTVPLVTRPCRYGGERQYFQCPNVRCRRRCEVLYSCGVYFLCRECCGYLYPSQKGDRLDKLVAARNKIGARIFEDWTGSEGWRKRKGMHWQTFEQHHHTYLALDEAWSREFYDRSKKLTGEGWYL